MAKIFISYRRSDSAFIAQALNERLQKRFGQDSVFLDIDTIPLGVDFREHIDQAVAQCDVLLVVIGDKWLIASDDRGRRRLDDPNDYVRIEVQAALNRNIPVIPVLVDEAQLPDEDELPEAIRKIVYRQKAELRSGQYLRQQYERIIRAIEQHCEPPSWPRTELLKALWESLKQGLDESDTVGWLTNQYRGIIAALAIVILSIIGFLCVTYLSPFTPPQISNIGVSLRDDPSSRDAVRALNLYKKKFPRLYPNFANHEIRLVTGNRDDHVDNNVLGVIGKLTSDWAICEVQEYEDRKLVYMAHPTSAYVLRCMA